MLNDRFWTKVDKSHSSGCWIWLASKNNKGYGRFRPGGTAPTALAHRVSFENAFGKIPKGKFILHSCDNPLCVNPAHLRIGTAKMNVADMDSRGRRVVSKARGESIATSILTEQQVIDLRNDYVSGLDRSAICKKYGISLNSLGDYTGGRSWRHLLGENGCPTLDQLKSESKTRTKSAAVITEDTVKEIRIRLEAGETGRSLAIEFGVHFATISDIKLRKTWI